MSSIEMEAARLASPTLRPRRTSSTQQAVLTRERLAAAGAERGPEILPSVARAEAFVDETLTVEGESPAAAGRWRALLLACATIAVGALILATSLSQ